ncbi:MAG: 4Fe-4S binding protein [Smithellaceae bacterium]
MNLSKLRVAVQLLSFTVLTYGGRFGLRLGYALPCFSCPYVSGCAGNCYLMALQGSIWGMAMPLAAIFTSRGGEALLMFSGFLLLTLVAGKIWCGWICPFGTLQDWIASIRKKLGIRESQWSWLQTDRLKPVKYVFLALLLVIPLVIAHMGLHDDFSLPFCQICPAKPVMPLFAGKADYFSIDTTNSITIFMTSLLMLLTAVFFVGMFFKDRFFCVFCPMLALIAIFDRLGFVRFSKQVKTCSGCANCQRICPVDIRTVHTETLQPNVMSPECMACMKCADVCPEDGTLSFKWFKWTLFTSSFVGAVRKLTKGCSS